MLARAMDEPGSVCGRMLCAVWHDAQFAATTSPFLNRRLAVDALRVVLEDVVLVDGPLALDDRALLVALAAGEGHLERRDRRERVPHGPDVVPPVARRARGSEQVAALDGLAVQRRRVLLGLRLVAVRAAHLLERGLVRQLLALEVGVAVDALQGAVNRCGERLLGHVQRDLAAPALRGEVLLAVTAQAVGVLLRARRRGREQRQHDGEPGQGARPSAAPRRKPWCHEHRPLLSGRELDHFPPTAGRCLRSGRKANRGGGSRSIDHLAGLIASGRNAGHEPLGAGRGGSRRHGRRPEQRGELGRRVVVDEREHVVALLETDVAARDHHLAPAQDRRR